VTISVSVTACARQPVDSRRTVESALFPAKDKGPTTPSSAPDRLVRPPGIPQPSVPTAQTLSEAAETGDAELVKSWLAGGVDRKALNEALLAAAGSEPLVVNDQGAFDLRYGEIARLLLEKGASIRARNAEGSTPLIVAANHGETAVVRLLLHKGAEIEAADNEGITALIAAACDCPIIDMPDTDDSVKLLLENGANIEAKDKQGRTALMFAAAWGRAWILQILLDKGARIDARDDQGNTALLLSVTGSALPMAEAVQLLLARGADIEASNNDGDTALILAASSRGYEDVKIVQMLLDHGADVLARNKQGHTALEMAARKGSPQVVALLRAAMAKAR
jgi:ankyrin repeat protein